MIKCYRCLDRKGWHDTFYNVALGDQIATLSVWVSCLDCTGKLLRDYPRQPDRSGEEAIAKDVWIITRGRKGRKLETGDKS